MPPQPLTRIASGIGIAFSLELVRERPEVAAKIGEAIACYSWVETQVSRLFVDLAGLNTVAATELFNAFDSARLKINAIKILAMTNLDKDTFVVIERLIKTVQSHQKIRDKLAHWYWAYSEQILDGLILVDSRYMVARHANLMEIQRITQKTPPLQDMIIPHDVLYVYRVSDLNVDIQAFVSLAQLVNKCRNLCFVKDEALAQLRRELLSDARLGTP